MLDLSLLPKEQQSKYIELPFSDDAVILKSLERDPKYGSIRPTLDNYFHTIVNPSGAFELAALSKFMDVRHFCLVT
jgi:hypothetical protein